MADKEEEKVKEKFYGFWKVKFRQWDNILHSLLCAIKNAQEEAIESNIPFNLALKTELGCDADLRTKARAWPKLVLKIIAHSIPPKAISICRRFVLSILK